MELIEYLSNPWTRAIVILIVFAGLDLMVWVSNDAVNFLNSAIGSKVATRRTIYRVAAAGILMGASFSGGMMEVARKGIFNPAMFTFYDIMIVFFSVVMADIVLMDIFNSLKLPTSTTVSIVFELLGAWLAIALIHLFKDNLVVWALGDFINASSTVSIVSGIFLSVGIAFVSWWMIQMIMRSIFSFQYDHHIKRYGWLLGGIAITAITYFLVVKWLKEAVFMPEVLMWWITWHTWVTVWYLFVWWSVLSFVMQNILKWDILKVIVLIGTFSLAAAFAGNDLVNFIGVSVAGYQSIMLYLAQWGGDMTQFMMWWLAGAVSTPQIFLFGSAVIMVLTLMFSKKAQSVTETEIGLTKHATGQEQFKPGRISRWLVKRSIKAHKTVVHSLPASWQKNIAWRFVQWSHHDQKEAAAFDLLRASVNLTLSAVLIAMATNMKLPLSTTYVTFMVAMGTALADGAWGRDSAVYRISGVLTIIGAWLMTAVIALTITLVLTTVLWNLGFWSVGIAAIMVWYLLYHSHFRSESSSNSSEHDSLATAANLSDVISHHIHTVLPEMKSLTHDVLKAMIEDNEAELIKLHRHADKLSTKTKIMKLDIHMVFAQLGSAVMNTWHIYVQSIEVLRKAALSLDGLAQICQEYVLNKHPDLIEEQSKELALLSDHLGKFISDSIQMIESDDFARIDAYDKEVDWLIDDLDDLKQLQFSRIKVGDVWVRNTTLYIGMMTELYTMLINIQKLVHYKRRMK